MRKTFSVFAVIAIVFVAPPAGAETWYAGGFGGINYTHDGNVNAAGTKATYDVGLALGGFVGFFVQENVRLEAELSYRTNDRDTLGGAGVGGSVDTVAVMANALFDFKIESQVEPYIGAGIGFADVDYAVVDETVLAVQMIAGAGIEVSPATKLTVDYRLFITEDLEVGGGVGLGNIEYVNSAVLVGLRRTF